MASVDIVAIEERMKMAQLDQLRGYKQDTFGEVQQYRSTDYIAQHAAGGYQVLREPLWNKGMLRDILPVARTSSISTFPG